LIFDDGNCELLLVLLFLASCIISADLLLIWL